MNEVVTIEPVVKRGRGRPPTFLMNPGIKDQLINYIRDGCYVTTAMTILGLSDDFYYRCQQYAEAGKSEYIELVRDVKKAEAQAEFDAIGKMRKGKEFFLPEATFLERRFRDRWGRSDRHQIEANINIRVESIDYAKLAKQMKPKK